MIDKSLDEIARGVFPSFDHDDKSELNMAVWEKIKEHIADALLEWDGTEGRRMIEEDRGTP